MSRPPRARPPRARPPCAPAARAPGRWLWLSLLGLAACAQDRPRRDAPETDADLATLTDAVLADATPADATPADATPPDATPPDATPADAGPAECQVAVARLDEAGAIVDSATCDLEVEADTCRQVGACICALIAPPEDQENCLWAVLGPRALQALGDYCHDGRTIAEVLAISDWQANGPSPFRLQTSPGCAAVPAR